MRIVTLLMTSLTLLVSVAATAEVDFQPGEYVVFYHHDVLGSPVTATNEQGQVIWHERTESYGKSEGRVSQNGNAFGDNALPAGDSRQGYTGHTLDNSAGLTYMKARYYDHNMGRFLSNDPVGFTINNPMMFNRYAYAYNNPYKYIDPDGRQAKDADNDGVADENEFGVDRSIDMFNLNPSADLFGGLETGGLSKSMVAGMKSKIQLAKNKHKGKNAEVQAAKDLKSQGNTILGEQVTIRTALGNRVVDVLIQDKSGNMKAIEVKSGVAVRSKTQIAKDNSIASSGGVIVGKNAPTQLRNTEISPIPVVVMQY